jgi:cytochrome c-type biogenesis protein
MIKTRIVAFLLAVIVSGALLSGCAADKQNDTENNQSKEEVTENQEESNKPSNKPSKEEVLKDMMEVPMEDFEAIDLDGNKVKLSDYKGKIIFLNFWATWCPPCREEMPFMQEIYDEYKGQDVVVLAVNSTSVELRGGTDSDKAESQTREFIKDKGYTFPVLLDKDDKAWSIYMQRGIPTNYIIDKQGIIRYGFSGAFHNKEQMIQLIENIRILDN